MYQTKLISGTSGLQELAANWDRLWSRIQSPVATLRAQSLIHWVDCFAHPSDLRIVAATRAGEFVTAIPLMLNRNRFGRVYAQALVNDWLTQNCLLDNLNESDDRFRAIEDGLRQLGLSKLVFPSSVLDQSSTQALMRRWKSRRVPIMVRHQFEGGLLRLQDDWQGYWSSLSRNRRKKLRNSETTLANHGQVEMVSFSGRDVQQAAQFIETALAIELASWKGQAKTALLCHPRAAQFVRRNGIYLASAGQLRVHLLTVDKRPIAFDLGYVAHGVYTSHKVAYSPEFKEYSPGQLLTIKLIEYLYRTGDAQAIDFLGPISGASEPWANERYRVGKLILSAGGWLSNLSVFATAKIADLVKPQTHPSVPSVHASI